MLMVVVALIGPTCILFDTDSKTKSDIRHVKRKCRRRIVADLDCITVNLMIYFICALLFPQPPPTQKSIDSFWCHRTVLPFLAAIRRASLTAHALRNENKEHGEKTGRHRVKIFSEMASQRPGEWVQALLARFDAQVNNRFSVLILSRQA